MALDSNLVSISLPAAGDLSAAQYKFVAINSSGAVAVVGTAGNTGDGVLQNKPSASGDVSTVAVFGVSKVLAGGAINPGAQVSSSAAGKAIAATSGHRVLGRHIGTTAAADGDIIPVLLKLQGEPNA